MKWSSSGIKTLREKPADADLPGHALLVRGGYIKKLATGIWTYGPLLLRTIKKFENIVREELNKIQCTEILMPIVQPKEIWVQSGRWELYADLLQKMVSRTGRQFCLGPTHEEVVAEYVRQNIQSHRDLPLCLYQIQTKFRDEIRPRFGLMRAKEFIMKDAYSFDKDQKTALESYQKMRSVYHAIFSRLKVSFRVVKADSGEIGGNQSEEFHILASHGEEELLVTDSTTLSKTLNPKVSAGDVAPDGKTFQTVRGIETGHIFYLGDKYSKAMSVTYKDPEGKLQHVQMGCYGIGITRTIQATVEQHYDQLGIRWPIAIAPFLVHICLLDPEDPKALQEANRIYQSLEQSLGPKQIDVFLDDRREKPGVKFKDADLLGMPLRINVGVRGLANSQVECVKRFAYKKDTVPLASLNHYVLNWFNENSA